jgi:hypothetical protein
VHSKVILFTSSKVISMFSSRGCMAGLSEFKFSLRAESQRPVSSQLLGFGTSVGVVGPGVGVTSLFLEASHTTPWPTP